MLPCWDGQCHVCKDILSLSQHLLGHISNTAILPLKIYNVLGAQYVLDNILGLHKHSSLNSSNNFIRWHYDNLHFTGEQPELPKHSELQSL